MGDSSDWLEAESDSENLVGKKIAEVIDRFANLAEQEFLQRKKSTAERIGKRPADAAVILFADGRPGSFINGRPVKAHDSLREAIAFLLESLQGGVDPDEDFGPFSMNERIQYAPAGPGVTLSLWPSGVLTAAQHASGQSYIFNPDEISVDAVFKKLTEVKRSPAFEGIAL